MDLQLPPNLATDAPHLKEGKTADVQVSSADILLEAHQLKQSPYKASKQTIQDIEELRLFQQAKRREFEQHLNKNRLNYGQWIRYAKWEVDHNHDFKRARSIMERALEVNIQHVPFWVRYVEMELLHRNINHARNLLDRAVTSLPYTNKLWYMYVQTEESLGNYESVRAVFERWLSWKPEKSVWQSYIGFEKRYDEFHNVRALFPRYLAEYPEGATWLEWADFERFETPFNEDLAGRIRGIFESALDKLAQDGKIETDESVPHLVQRWAAWEASQGEVERGRQVIKMLSGFLTLAEGTQMVSQLLFEFQSKLGDASLADTAAFNKRKAQRELELAKNPRDYTAWWEYIKLERLASVETKRNIFQRSIAAVPEENYKLLQWRRYVFLWIRYALWEEFDNSAIENARDCWAKVISIIPHKSFSFSKVWIMRAQFEIRSNDETGINSARKVLGKAIGLTCTTILKNKIFKFYIELEKKLNEWGRVRSLYSKWIETALLFDFENPGSHAALRVLKDFVEMELELEEVDRCLAMYDAALDSYGDGVDRTTMFTPYNDLLNMYIDFLKDELLYDRARDFFRKKLDEQPTPELWIRFADFELSILSPEQLETLETLDDVEFRLQDHQKNNTRKVFTDAVAHYKRANEAIPCMTILEAWKNYEMVHGDPESVQKVEKRFPTEVIKRRPTANGEEMYKEYVFPQEAPNINKFLANAKKWATQGPSEAP